MPLLDNNALDDQLLLDGNLNFSAGQFSDMRPSLVPESGYAAALNMDFDVFGNLVTRRGVAQLVGNPVDGIWESVTSVWESTSTVWSDAFIAPVRELAYFDTPTAEYVIVADGGNTIKLASETSAIATVVGSSYSGSDVYFSQLVDRMYYCDGVGALKYVTQAGGGTHSSISAGRITSVEITEGGRGYTAPPTVAAVGSGAGATFTAILGPDGKVVAITVDTAGTGYSSNTIITITAAPVGGTDATALARVSQLPSKPKLLVTHTNRLFATSADTAVPSDTLYASDILDGESWDLYSNSVRVGGGDGDPIIALMPWYGYKLLVFKERSVWVVEANPAEAVTDWAVQLINNRTGCVARKTVQQVGGDVFFLARDGVRSLSTIESGAQTLVAPPVSSPVNDIFEAANKTNLHRSCGAFHNGRYFVTIPSGDNPDTTLVYNAEKKAWSGEWSGWEPNSFAITAFGGKIRLMFGDEGGKLYTWLDYVDDSTANESYYLDQAMPYPSHVLVRALGFKEEYGDKFGYQVQFELDNTLLNPQDVSFYLIKNLADADNILLQEDGSHLLMEDGHILSYQTPLVELAEDVTIPASTGLFRKSFNLQSKGRFAYLQFWIETESGRMSLHAVKASAFSDTIRPERNL